MAMIDQSRLGPEAEYTGLNFIGKNVTGPEVQSYMIIGDWGRRGRVRQPQVASAMDEICTQAPFRSIISLGDNFYTNGVRSIDDSHWADTWRNVYNGHCIRDLPWIVILGNHDHHGNIQAQIDYSTSKKPHSQSWLFPARYYSQDIVFENNQTALFVFLDTTPFVDGNEYGTGGQAFLDTQLQWVEETLSASRHDWILVFGHHPLFTTGDHSENDGEMQDIFLPLFEKYAVSMYFQGHNHLLEHLTWQSGQGWDMHFVTSGSGAGVKAEATNSIGELVFKEYVAGFATLTPTPAGTLLVQLLDFGPFVRHSFEVLHVDRIPFLSLPSDEEDLLPEFNQFAVENVHDSDERSYDNGEGEDEGEDEGAEAKVEGEGDAGATYESDDIQGEQHVQNGEEKGNNEAVVADRALLDHNSHNDIDLRNEHLDDHNDERSNVHLTDHSDDHTFMLSPGPVLVMNGR